jgi:hypothetical protein
MSNLVTLTHVIQQSIDWLQIHIEIFNCWERSTKLWVIYSIGWQEISYSPQLHSILGCERDLRIVLIVHLLLHLKELFSSCFLRRSQTIYRAIGEILDLSYSTCGSIMKRFNESIDIDISQLTKNFGHRNDHAILRKMNNPHTYRSQVADSE